MGTRCRRDARGQAGAGQDEHDHGGAGDPLDVFSALDRRRASEKMTAASAMSSTMPGAAARRESVAGAKKITVDHTDGVQRGIQAERCSADRRQAQPGRGAVFVITAVVVGAHGVAPRAGISRSGSSAGSASSAIQPPARLPRGQPAAPGSPGSRSCVNRSLLDAESC